MLLTTKARHELLQCVPAPLSARCSRRDGSRTQCKGKSEFPHGTGHPSGNVYKRRKQPSSKSERETWGGKQRRWGCGRGGEIRRQAHHMHEDCRPVRRTTAGSVTVSDTIKTKTRNDPK